MSSPELEIENAVVGYLTTQLPLVKIEAVGNTNYSDEEHLARAQGFAKGYVIVQYMGSTTEIPRNEFKQYKITGRYILYLFAKSRKDRDGIYQLLEDIKTNMIEFEHTAQRFTYKGDVMHPFPVSKGLFLCEVEFELIQMRRF